MTLVAAPAPVPAREAKPRGSVFPGRLVSLDAYRGFVMFLMASGGLAIAQTAERYFPHSHLWNAMKFQVDHVEWGGCALWDLIQPSFTFIVGVALPFSIARRRAEGQTVGRLVWHAIYRSIILIALGIFLRSIGKPRTYYTFEDTLTQIGLGYTFCFLLAWTKPRIQLLALVVILIGYWLGFALYPLPTAADYQAAQVAHPFYSGFAAHWDKNTNLAAHFDRWFLNLFPRQRPFNVNGGGYLTLSFIPTLGTMICGLLAGHLLRSRRPPDKKFWTLVAVGFLGLILGEIFDRTGVCPVVKRIWTPSWVLYSAGWSCLLLAAFYALIDWAGYRAWAFPLVVIGMNSIAMYCMADGGFASYVRDALRTHLGPYRVFDCFGNFRLIAESAATLLILWLVLLWMYRKRIFLRI